MRKIGNLITEIKCTDMVIKGDLVEIHFEDSLNESEEMQLRQLISAKYTEPTIFDAIVDANGNGDFTSVAEAFLAGKTSVFVRDGVYVETRDILLPDGGQLVGESQSNVKIVLVSKNSIRVDGSDGKRIESGRISIYRNSSIVQGNGTEFTKAEPGSYILLGTNFYEIGTIQSDVTLELLHPYSGNDIVDAPCLVQRMFTGIKISNLVISESSSFGLFVRAVRHSSFRGIAIMRCSANFLIQDSGDFLIADVVCGFSQEIGLHISNSHSVHLSTLDVYNSLQHGIQCSQMCSSIIIDSSACSNNAGCGVFISRSVRDLNINLTILQNNQGSGIQTDETVQNITVAGCTISKNGQNGLEMPGLQNLICSTNRIFRNAGNGIVANRNCNLNGNFVDLNGGDGLVGVGENLLVTSNCFSNNAGCGARLSATNSLVSSNIFRSNGQKGFINDSNSAILLGNLSTQNVQSD